MRELKTINRNWSAFQRHNNYDVSELNAPVSTSRKDREQRELRGTTSTWRFVRHVNIISISKWNCAYFKYSVATCRSVKQYKMKVIPFIHFINVHTPRPINHVFEAAVCICSFSIFIPSCSLTFYSYLRLHSVFSVLYGRFCSNVQRIFIHVSNAIPLLN